MFFALSPLFNNGSSQNLTVCKNSSPTSLNSLLAASNGTGTYTHYYDGNPTTIVLTVTFIETQLLSRINFIPQDEKQKLDDIVKRQREESNNSNNK